MMDGSGNMETSHTPSFQFNAQFFAPIPSESIQVGQKNQVVSRKKTANCWNAFQRDHQGQFRSTAEAAAAYKTLKEKQSPWPLGFEYKKHVRKLQPGEQFHMIVGENMEDVPGRFGTMDFIDGSKYGRQRLAIKKSWKSSLEHVVTYRVLKPFDVYEGPVGPQIDGKEYLPGGGTQFIFKDIQTAWLHARPNEYNHFTCDPYLEVVSIRKLEPE